MKLVRMTKLASGFFGRERTLRKISPSAMRICLRTKSFWSLVCRMKRQARQRNWEQTQKGGERRTPFVAILIDLGGIEYVLTSADLASISAAIAAWVRGLVAPCTMVMTGSSADMLRKVLEITKPNQIDELRVVDTKESGDWTTLGQRSIECAKRSSTNNCRHRSGPDNLSK